MMRTPHPHRGAPRHACSHRRATFLVWQVRRQFAERPGIMDGSQKPDYARCVSIVAEAALSEMRAPGALALFFPILQRFGTGNTACSDVTGISITTVLAGGSIFQSSKHRKICLKEYR